MATFEKLFPYFEFFTKIVRIFNKKKEFLNENHGPSALLQDKD